MGTESSDETKYNLDTLNCYSSSFTFSSNREYESSLLRLSHVTHLLFNKLLPNNVLFLPNSPLTSAAWGFAVLPEYKSLFTPKGISLFAMAIPESNNNHTLTQ